MDMLCGSAVQPACQKDSHVVPGLADGGLNRHLAALVGAIGLADFDQRLTRLFAAMAAIDQFNMIALDDGQHAQSLYTWHRMRPDLTHHLVGQYLEGRHYIRDQALVQLRRQPQGQLRMGMLRPDQIEDSWYRAYFFDDARLGGKLSILTDGQDRHIYQNYYCAAGSNGFSPREAETMARLSDVVAQAVIRHRQLTAMTSDSWPLDWAQSAACIIQITRLLAQRAPGLARRESEVCARILTGHTTEAIALDLGIAGNSVATYRKRAYAKLGICSQHQLFMLCLGTDSEPGRIKSG